MLVEFAKDLLRLFFWYPVRWMSMIMPRSLLMKIGALLGHLLFSFATERRQVIGEEIGACLPGIPASELRQIVRKSAICFMKDQCDVLLYPHLDPKKTGRITRVSGLEYLEQYQQNKQGVILLLCHLGSNQFLMPALGFRGYQIGQVSLPADAVDIVFADHKISPIHRRMLALKRKMEESLPTRHIFLDKGLWEALDWIKSGNILAIAVDGRHGNRFRSMHFCGRVAQYSPGPFILSLRTGAPLLPTFILRENDDRHHVIIESPLPRPKSTHSAKNEFLEQTMTAYLQRLEHYFNKYPEQYGMFFFLARKHTSGKENALFVD